MKINLSDKLIAYLALISGLSISAVAIYYSVAGLVAIFAAAVIPITIMGIVLEVGKLSATVWLKQNWLVAPRFLKAYLLIAITVLMLITSMGIFGFLSKAHLDQAVPTGDVSAKVSLLDEKIKTERDNIETARTALKQMDAQVDARLNRSDDEKGAERAVQIRRQQQAERGRLQKDIADSQGRIAKLNEERAPIAAELRKVEAEVGPIKYIAALLYGNNPDANLLEEAVRWVIIVIVLVFDPLAVILLLASQYSFSWFRKQEEENPQEQKQKEEEPEPLEEMASDLHELENFKDETAVDDPPYRYSLWPFPSSIATTSFAEEEKQKDLEEHARDQDLAEDVNFTSKSHDGMGSTLDDNPEIKTNNEGFDEKKPLDEWNEMIAEAEKAVEQEKEIEEDKILEEASHTEKQAMKKWKEENPDSSLKQQKMLLHKGLISKLPWDDYLKAKADFSDDEAAEEAAKWAMEQLEAKKKDNSDLDRETRETTDQEVQRGIDGYQQNAEQNERTLWQRIQDAKK